MIKTDQVQSGFSQSVGLQTCEYLLKPSKNSDILTNSDDGINSHNIVVQAPVSTMNAFQLDQM
ncbi:MAG: hypothetical protein Q4P13_10925 [Psychrobacter sp.]|nr:hypothetical protein [Psychrobacter sp.]